MEVSEKTRESWFTINKVENLPFERVISTSRKGSLSSFSSSDVKEMFGCWWLR